MCGNRADVTWFAHLFVACCICISFYRARYEREMAAFYRATHRAGTSFEAIPKVPKRPMSAFLSFSKAHRAEMKAANSRTTNGQISKLLAEKWHATPQEEKQPFIDEHSRQNAEYNIAMRPFRADKKARTAPASASLIDTGSGVFPSSSILPNPMAAAASVPSSWLQPSHGEVFMQSHMTPPEPSAWHQINSQLGQQLPPQASYGNYDQTNASLFDPTPFPPNRPSAQSLQASAGNNDGADAAHPTSEDHSNEEDDKPPAREHRFDDLF